MRAGELSAAASCAAGGDQPPSWRQLAIASALLTGVVLAVAGVVHLLAPDWLGDSGERELADRPLLVLDILVNNLLLALIPLLGGWLAAGHLAAGRNLVGGAFVALAAIVVARSLATIGAVGGADPAWLADAARWWLLEVAALAVAARTGLWLCRHPELRDEHGAPALRRALWLVVGALALGACVEVLSA